MEQTLGVKWVEGVVDTEVYGKLVKDDLLLLSAGDSSRSPFSARGSHDTSFLGSSPYLALSRESHLHAGDSGTGVLPPEGDVRTQGGDPETSHGRSRSLGS